VGFDARRVHEHSLNIQRLSQIRLDSGLLQQRIDYFAHGLCRKPIGVTLKRALAWNLDTFQMVEQAEFLQHGTVGQTRAEIPIAFAEESACDIAAHGLARVLLEYALLPGADKLGRSVMLLKPPLGAQNDKLLLYFALFKQLVDAVHLLAEYLVIDISHDSGQWCAKMRLKSNYIGCHAYSL